jgi:AcrR family transcriptional regulator
MARTHDPHLKKDILKTCANQAIQMGMRNVSLLRLSQEIDISPRMLIYHFGSKDNLLKEATLEAQNELRSQLELLLVKNKTKDTKLALLQLWRHGISHKMEVYFVAFFNLYAEAIGNQEREKEEFITQSIDGWICWAKQTLFDHSPILSQTDYTVILALLRGLFLDYWATRDERRTTAAIKSFLNSYNFGNC